MTAECWFRSPFGYQHQLIAEGVRNYAAHRAYPWKRNVQPLQWARTHLPLDWEDWRLLHIGDQGTAEYRADQTRTPPVAVYPTWRYGADPLELLLFMLENPAGKDPDPYTIPGNPIDTQPVAGQEHRVVVMDLPSRRFDPNIWLSISAMQDDYPEATIHISGQYQFKDILGLGFSSFDQDARSLSQRPDRVLLANGREVHHEHLAEPEHAQWVHLMGMSISDLEKPKNRCIFHIRSTRWAARQWDSREQFRIRPDPTSKPDIETPTASWKPNVVKTRLRRRGADVRGDMIACDVCSLADRCRAFRAGSICTLPESSVPDLAALFGSSDVDKILAGMQEIMVKQATRAEHAMRKELYEDDDLDPEVTKILDGLFSKGEKMAKLRDPKRFAKPAISINNQNVQLARPGPAGAIGATDQQTAVARAMASLEEAGWDRVNITRELVEEVMRTGHVPAAPLEIELVGDEDEFG